MALEATPVSYISELTISTNNMADPRTFEVVAVLVPRKLGPRNYVR